MIERRVVNRDRQDSGERWPRSISGVYLCCVIGSLMFVVSFHFVSLWVLRWVVVSGRFRSRGLDEVAYIRKLD